MESFRQSILELSKRISVDELEDLTYLCQDVLGKTRVNNIKTPLHLFKALEECGKLSVNNTEYLVDMLNSTGKSDLVGLLHGSAVNSVAEETHPSYNNKQQPVYTSHPGYLPPLSQIWEFESHHTLYNNAAITPQYTVEEQYRSLPWEAGTRGASAQRNSDVEGLPLYPSFPPGTPVDPIRLSPGDQQQWQLERNTYNKRVLSISNQQTEYRSESPLAQSFHQEDSPEVGYFSECTTAEAHHSAPLTNELLIQQAGLLANKHQFYRRSDHFHTSAFTTNHSLTPLAAHYQREILSQPIQEEDDDRGPMTTCSFTSTTGDINISQTKSITIQEHHDQIYQLTQEMHSLREKYEQQSKQHEQYCKQMEQMQQQIKNLSLQTHQSDTLMGDRYQMNKNPHGIAVIINNDEFHSTDPNKDTMPNRQGSEVDENSLHTLWSNLQYDVRLLKNCTASELLDKLKKIASLSHANYDSFVCCILSHGYSDGVYGADGQPVKIKDVANLFEGRQSPTLFGKPKMFFIQACRGDDEDEGVFPSDEVQKDGKDVSKSLPSDADFFFAYSTAPGKASYRSQQHGSWYISILCQVFNDYAHHTDLFNMLTIVNDHVSIAYTKSGYKQCPALMCFLRKQVWFL